MATKQVIVKSLDFNKTTIKGKEVDQAIVVLTNTEKGTDKKEFVPAFNKLYSAIAVLAVGDICDAAWEKKTVNGKDYFNLVQLTKTGSGGVAPAKASGGASAPAKSYGKSPEDQLSICRQNVNNVAMQFVTKLLEQGIYPKKSTPDMLFEEIKRFSKKFEAYVTLKDDYSQLVDDMNVEISDDDKGMLD